MFQRLPTTTISRVLLRPRAGAAISFAARRASPAALARPFSTGKDEAKSGGSWAMPLTVLALGGAGFAYYYQDDLQKVLAPAAPLKPLNYQDVYNDIAAILENPDYDDGSYGPVLVRLAWHAAGTYDKTTGTGGSNGATMRFSPEAGHGANAGLDVARNLLEPIKKKHPQISYSDLWSLAGVVAIQEMGGPVIPWRPGRVDAVSAEACTPDGRLPAADKAQDHLRDIFYRMGFNDQEIVALAGAHALGRCHTDRSGFEGPWTFAPTTFSNDYFVRLTQDRWSERKWSGPKQFQDKTGKLMMLPADMALIKDRAFSKHVYAYAKNSDLFFKDFAAAFKKLLELGVPFKEDTPTFTFKST
ncbi:heme peroxidase [Chytridiales sp. JEL 0842]|nr:heme peroxidase [Chytridiales sp. JEL 0842]